MKFNYLLGRPATGKSEHIFKSIKKDLEDESVKKIILLVPEQYTLQAEQDLINKMELSGMIKVQVQNFKSLARILRAKNGGKSRKIIDEIGLYMLISRAADKNRKGLKVFKTSYNKRGFVEDMVSTIGQFKKSCIDAELLKSRIVELEEDSALRNKLEDILLIYEHMQSHMDKAYLDENDILTQMRENIEKTDYFEGAKIYIDGFSTFSAKEYEVLEPIILKSKETTLALTMSNNRWDRDYSVFGPVVDTFNRINRILDSERVKSVEHIKKEKHENPRSSLAHLEKELFAYPTGKYEDSVEGIKINSYLNRNEEVENVAIRIVEMVMNKGARWKDILVVSNNTDMYQSIVKRVFSEYKIPYFLDETRDITSHNLIRYVLAILETVNKGFRYYDVFKAIKTNLTNLTEAESEALENYVLQFNIKGEGYFSEFSKGLEDYPGINGIREKFVENLPPIREFFKKKNSITDINKKVFEHMMKMNIKEKIDILVEEQEREGNLDISSETAQMWNILIDVLDQMTEMLGNTEVKLEEYVKLLEAGLSNYKIGIVPPTMDQVTVGNLERTKSSDIDHLFVIGVNDGILPAAIEDRGVLLEEDKLTLKEMGFDMKLEHERKIQEENYRIYSALTRPRKSLNITFPLADEEGRALRQSTLIDRIKFIYPKIRVISDINLGESKSTDKITSKDPTIKYLVKNFRDYIEGADIDESWFDVYKWYSRDGERESRVDDILGGLFYVNQQEYVDEEISRKLYSMPMKSSISRIEKFANCPFAHFVNYGLRPKERKKGIIKMPDVGSLLHSSIEHYSKELKRRGHDWKTVDKSLSDSTVDEVIDKMIGDFQNGIFLSSNRYRYMVNKLRRVSKKAVWTAASHLRSGEFEPRSYELKFGDGGIPPIVFQLPNGEELRLEGRIDRVDIYDDGEKSYVKVIDYKSGSKDFSLLEAYCGLQIQLVVYLEAVLRNKDLLVKNEMYPAGAFFFKIRDPIVNGSDMGEEQIEKDIAKEMKMSGLVLKDVNVVKLMDKDIAASSDILPAGLKKDGEFSARSSAFELEEIKALMEHVNSLIKAMAEEMMKGKVKIEPCKVNGTTSCAYCEFGSICRFDTDLEGNEYRKIRKLKDSEIKNKLKADME